MQYPINLLNFQFSKLAISQLMKKTLFSYHQLLIYRTFAVFRLTFKLKFEHKLTYMLLQQYIKYNDKELKKNEEVGRERSSWSNSIDPS